MIYSALKKTIIFYLIAGIILSITIVSAVVLTKYENSLLDAIRKFEHVRINALKMKQASMDIDSVIKEINNLLPPHYYSKSPKESILSALDAIKMTIKGVNITITSFAEKEGEITLPVNINFSIPLDDYEVLVNNIGYLQSLNFPHFTINNIVIARAGQPPGAIICKIDGLLRMSGKEIGRL
ncbi:MAG TPA: hypothetical protein DEP99_01820 [Nitrospiraceae bacterium]|nr:hypothetical protein [Nitrospiraceae bacterium]